MNLKSRSDANRRRYKRGRRKLILEMGRKCQGVLANSKPCKETRYCKLEFHHLEERTWNTRKKNRWIRIALYRREWKAGKVTLLCGACNKKAGIPPASREQEEREMVELREFLES